MRTRTADPLITNQVLYQLSYKGSVAELTYRDAREKPERSGAAIAGTGDIGRRALFK